ncbi:MAG TPA: hypothetical protein VFN23_03565 [Ktedonobacteraceae bacterium]|nr:hypothetical protein [Ktedonobacteraceae bacterium]
MVTPSVFISALTAGSPRQEFELGRQLIEDLEHAGVKVVVDDGKVPDSRFFEMVQPALKSCTWFILIQTGIAMNSLRVQVTMSSALQQVHQQTMRGIIRIICPSSEMNDSPPLWSATNEIPFTGDYPRVRDKILLELDLLRIDDVIEKAVTKIPTSPLKNTGTPDSSLAKLKDMPASMMTPPRNTSPRAINIPSGTFTRPQHPPAIGAHPQSPPFTGVRPAIGDRPAQPLASERKLSRFIPLAIALFILLFILSLAGALILPRLMPPSPLSVKQPNPPPKNQVIAQDNFQRGDRQFWGTTPGGQTWEGDANANNHNSFSIANHTGKIQGVPGTVNYSAILGPATADSDVTMTFTINELSPKVNRKSGADFGIVLRWVNPNQWYKAFIDGSNLSLNKHTGAGTSIPLAKPFPFKAQAGQSYTLRFRIMGNRLEVKAWASNQPEPQNWMLDTRDKNNPITQGQAGLRATLMPTTTVNVSSFQEINLAP